MNRVDCSTLSDKELEARLVQIKLRQRGARWWRDENNKTGRSGDYRFFVDRCEHLALLGLDVYAEKDIRMLKREIVADAVCAAAEAVYDILKEAGVSITDAYVLEDIAECVRALEGAHDE